MATIGMFDSGVGGLSVLREVRKLLPDARYIYYSDNAYCPYGEKTREQILSRAQDITDWLLFKGADIIVIACNTATAAAVAFLRDEYGGTSERVSRITGGRRNRVSFVGMEPAVKPAALGTRSGVIGVLATAGTLSGSKYLSNKEKYEDDVKIVEHVGEGFVELVEGGRVSGPRAEEVVERSVRPLLDEGADTIVLGCTHYPFLRATIEKICGPEVMVIDPAPAVARRVRDVLEQETVPPGGGYSLEWRSSGPSEAMERMLALV